MFNFSRRVSTFSSSVRFDAAAFAFAAVFFSEASFFSAAFLLLSFFAKLLYKRSILFLFEFEIVSPLSISSLYFFLFFLLKSMRSRARLVSVFLVFLITDAIAPVVMFLAAFAASADSKKEPRFTFTAGVFSRFFSG